MSHAVYLTVYNKTTIFGMSLIPENLESRRAPWTITDIIINKFGEVFCGIAGDSAARSTLPRLHAV
jgi:hypothetical protein